jgi:NAD(P)H-quinone oxidoreductase subunit 4L
MGQGSAWLEWVNLAASLALLGIGLICLLTRKRVIQLVIGLNVMLQGALLAIVDAGRANGNMHVVQGMVISALVAEMMVLAIALALIVNVFRFNPEGQVDDLSKLKG